MYLYFSHFLCLVLIATKQDCLMSGLIFPRFPQGFLVWRSVEEKIKSQACNSLPVTYFSVIIFLLHLSGQYELCHEKPAFCISKNKGSDQLHGNRAADQRLFH